MKWWLLAAEQGLAEAQFNLGVTYQEGQGVQQDDTEAAKWYRLIVEINQLVLRNTDTDDIALRLMTECDMTPDLAFRIEKWILTEFLGDVMEYIVQHA